MSARPNAQIAQGATTEMKTNTNLSKSDIDGKISKVFEFLVEDTSESCLKVKVQRGLVNLIS